MSEETLSFQAEVSKLLQIVANSLYSKREVFLRELISNGSDACDRLRYESLTSPELIEEDADFCVTLESDDKAKTLIIEDNGIGMDRDELINNLGTIARSGSSAFLEGLSGDESKDLALIGQFGVGFYSGFIVAKKVVVISRRAGSSEAWEWSSTGTGKFKITAADREKHGTSIILNLKKEAEEFLQPEVLRRTVRAHSDHIGIPIILKKKDGDETLNSASALWVRPKNEITEDQYDEFYRQVSHGFDSPWMTLHVRAEGRLEFTLLLFIPNSQPLDLFQPDRKCSVRLCVKRVFVTDECEGLLPSYLRFLRGVIDTEDIALNVSREMLQQDPILSKIGADVVKRVLSALEKKAKKDPKSYIEFWNNFGAVLKEGLYEDPTRKEQLLKLARFHSTNGDELVSLEEYLSRISDKQEKIYLITGDDLDSVRSSPQLEGYEARGIEVLLLTDPVDEFWVPSIGNYQEKPFVSVMRGNSDLNTLETSKSNEGSETSSLKPGDVAVLVALMKQSLGDKVKEVRSSERLTTSAVCLVADDSDPDRHLAKMLKLHGKLKEIPPGVLEINPKHSLIRALAEKTKKKGSDKELESACYLLFDLARIIEGDPPLELSMFAKRFTDLLEKKI